MRLLFDQNLSHRLCLLLEDVFFGSEQVRLVSLDQATDVEIWDFAARGAFTIVTLDADFADIATLRGAPPKVIWLRCGNQSTAYVSQLLRNHAKLIVDFVLGSDAACLEIY